MLIFALQHESIPSASRFQPLQRFAPKVAHDIWNRLQNGVHIRICVIFAQRDAQGTVGCLAGAPDGQQDVAWLQGTGGAGRAGGDTDALPGSRFCGSPLRIALGIWARPLISRSRSAVVLPVFSVIRVQASSSAAAIPTMAGTFSVPARLPRS